MRTRAAWVLLGLLALGSTVRPCGAGPEEGGRPRVLRLTLDEAVRMGLESGLRLGAGRYDPALARLTWLAETFAFDPLLTASFEAGHAETPSVSAFFGRDVVTEDTFGLQVGLQRLLQQGGTVSFLYRADRLSTDSLFVTLDPSWTQTLSLEASQPLLRGAGDRVLADVRRARNDVRAAEESLRALTEEVLLEVASAYWDLVFAQEEVLSRRKAEEVATELLRDAEARLAGGTGTPLDVAEARAGVQQRRGDRVAAEGARGAAEDRLRVLVLPFRAGADLHLQVVASEDPRRRRRFSFPAEQLDRYVRVALGTRPEVRASRAALANRRLDVHVAADALRPQLDLVGRVSTQALDRDLVDSGVDALAGEALSGSVGLQFSMFLGQRAARANLRLAEWARRQAVLQHRELENQIVAEVRGAARDVHTATVREEAGRVEVAAGQEALDGERERLVHGRSTPFRVLQKDEALTGARTREARASADRLIAQARFWKAVGMLAEQFGVEPPQPPR